MVHKTVRLGLYKNNTDVIVASPVDKAQVTGMVGWPGLVGALCSRSLTRSNLDYIALLA